MAACGASAANGSADASLGLDTIMDEMRCMVWRAGEGGERSVKCGASVREKKQEWPATQLLFLFLYNCKVRPVVEVARHARKGGDRRAGGVGAARQGGMPVSRSDGRL